MQLQTLWTPVTLADAFARHGTFPFPLAALSSTPAAKKRLDIIVAHARKTLTEPWPSLTATSYLRYFRDGNRSEFEVVYFNRRRRLGAIALAAAATGEPAFVSAMADGLWLICDESTWCLPAHLRLDGPKNEPSNLPATDSTGLYIDLFNCETGFLIAELCQLHATALAQIDPRIVERARSEVRRRLIDPILAGAEPRWMTPPNNTSNWAPWCASSLIAAAGFACAADPVS